MVLGKKQEPESVSHCRVNALSSGEGKRDVAKLLFFCLKAHLSLIQKRNQDIRKGEDALTVFLETLPEPSHPSLTCSSKWEIMDLHCNWLVAVALDFRN